MRVQHGLIVRVNLPEEIEEKEIGRRRKKYKSLELAAWRPVDSRDTCMSNITWTLGVGPPHFSLTRLSALASLYHYLDSHLLLITLLLRADCYCARRQNTARCLPSYLSYAPNKSHSTVPLIIAPSSFPVLSLSASISPSSLFFPLLFLDNIIHFFLSYFALKRE